RAHSCKPRTLRSALWRIRGFANSGVRIAWRAIAWRNTIDLLISASPTRRDVVAGALDLCMGGFGLRRQYWVFDWQDNLPSNDYPLWWEDGLTDERISAVEEIFSHYGSATVLFARFFPVLRQLNGIVAGALGMSWWRFLLFNAIGAALWVAAWVCVAIYFSAHTAAA